MWGCTQSTMPIQVAAGFRARESVHAVRGCVLVKTAWRRSDREPPGNRRVLSGPDGRNFALRNGTFTS